MLRRLFSFAADLWTQRELLWQFTLRNVELRHKGSHLGLIWSFLNPLLMSGLYVLVFGYIIGGSFGVLPDETRTDYALGIFFGITLFQFVAEVMGVSPTTIIYPATKIPSGCWVFLRFNPVLLAIELARNTALWAQPLKLHPLACLYAARLVSCDPGHAAFRRMKPAIADVL